MNSNYKKMNSVILITVSLIITYNINYQIFWGGNIKLLAIIIIKGINFYGLMMVYILRKETQLINKDECFCTKCSFF
jgi:hypothetical protein